MKDLSEFSPPESLMSVSEVFLGSSSSKNKSEKVLTRGFMDDSDSEEPEIEIVSSAEAEMRKMAMEKALFGDTNSENRNEFWEKNAAENFVFENSSIIPSVLNEDDDSMSSLGILPVASLSEKNSDSDDEMYKVKKDEKRESSISLRGSPVKDADSNDGLKTKSSLQGGKPRKERFSKKLAMEEMKNLHKDTQRLIREQKVSLPKHVPEAMSFTEFFDLVKPAKNEEKIESVEKSENVIKPAEKKIPLWLDRVIPAEKEKFISKTPSFIDLSNDGEEEPLADPPSKLDVFINRFLKHAKRAPPGVSALNSARVPVSSKAPATTVASSEQIPIVDGAPLSAPGAWVAQIIGSSAHEIPSQSAQKQQTTKLMGATQFDHLQKPGAKLTALKAMLEDEIEEKREKIIQKQQEKFRAEEEKQKKMEEEEKMESDPEEEEEEMTDGEEESQSSGESEPDEEEIAGDDYGMDEKEAEENEFAMDEAEEVDEDEVEASGDEEEDHHISDVDLDEPSEDDEVDLDDAVLEKNDLLKGAALDEDDDDPLAGIGELNDLDGNTGSSDSSDSRESARSNAPDYFPGSLAHDLDQGERERLMQLCSFDNDNAVFGTAHFPAVKRNHEIGDQLTNKTDRPVTDRQNPLQNDLMASMDDPKELMNLLSCASADFKTYKEPSPKPESFSLTAKEDDDALPVKVSGKKKHKINRRRVLLDDDDEDEDEAVETTSQKSTQKSDSDFAETQKEFLKNPRRRRVVQPESDSEEEEDEEEENEEEEEEDEDNFSENSHRDGKFRNEDEEMEYLERQFNPTLPRKASEFFEGEAEQSEDEYMGSGDEDEDGLDEIRQEDIDFQDNRYFSLSKQQREAVPEYLRKIGEDDENLEDALKDRFLHEDEDLPKLPTTSYGEGITFRLNEDGEVLDGDKIDTEDDAADNAWRVRRFEREQLLASIELKPDEEDDSVFKAENSFSVFCKKICENADGSFNLQSESFSVSTTSDGRTSSSFKRNSIKSKGAAVMARLNEVIDVEERPIAPLLLQNVSSRQTLSIDGTSSVRKVLQTDLVEGPTAKRRRLGNGPIAAKPSVFSLLGN